MKVVKTLLHPLSPMGCAARKAREIHEKAREHREELERKAREKREEVERRAAASPAAGGAAAQAVSSRTGRLPGPAAGRNPEAGPCALKTVC